MSEFKGTPGEWKAIDHSWSRIGIYAGETGIAALDIYDRATEENEDQLNREMKANAVLMASSRDMLAALQLVYCGNSLTSGEQAVCAAAIAKALGVSVEHVIQTI